jgi:hypothetical protein
MLYYRNWRNEHKFECVLGGKITDKIASANNIVLSVATTILSVDNIL